MIVMGTCAGQQQAESISGVRLVVDDVQQEAVKFGMLDGKHHAIKLSPTATGCSHMDSTFLNAFSERSNELLTAALLAFKAHHALHLSPDVIFATVMQGVSMHVNANPEQHRHSFVAHEGKKLLEVVDDWLVLGSWGNRWDRPVAELCQKVAAHALLCMLF